MRSPLAHDERLLLREDLLDVRLEGWVLLQDLRPHGTLLGRLDLAVRLDVLRSCEPAQDGARTGERGSGSKARVQARPTCGTWLPWPCRHASVALADPRMSDIDPM